MIRNATISDVSTILQFIRALAEYEKLSHMVTADEATLTESLFGSQAKTYALIAETDGKPVGFAVYFYNFSTFLGRPGIYIEDIFVDPAARGRGIGKAFFEYLARKAVAERCGRVEWSVLDWNTPAIEFYESMGATALNEWKMYRLTGDALRTLAQS